MSPPKVNFQASAAIKLKKIKKRSEAKRTSKRKFEFGNYNRYYGYRNMNGVDGRVLALESRKDLFLHKDILDIGCNIGHITYQVAKKMQVNSILGIDIDKSLIQIARKIAYHYIDVSPVAVDTSICDHSEPNLAFPDNSNYVLPHDELLDIETPKYDVILCLSITKWIHLNWGDEGLLRTFKRIFLQLRSNGVLVLEAQPIESYKKKKIPAKQRSYVGILKLLPSKFNDLLLKEIGFDSVQNLTVPNHYSKGFNRPIQLFFKK